MTKRKLRRRIADLEMQLTELRLPPPLTFDVLTIGWDTRTVTFKGRTVDHTGQAPNVAYPVTNDQHLLVRAGWWPE